MQPVRKCMTETFMMASLVALESLSVGFTFMLALSTMTMVSLTPET